MRYHLVAAGNVVVYEGEERAECACGVEAASDEGGNSAGITAGQMMMTTMMMDSIQFFFSFTFSLIFVLLP